MLEILPRLLPALGTTLVVSLLSLAIGMVLGISLGMVRVLSQSAKPIRWLIDAYVWFVRGTPIIIQIYIAYFFLPMLGLKWNVFWIGVVALVFNSVGYQVEIVRGAIASVDQGQLQSAAAIGMTPRMAMLWVVLPQATRRMIPPLTNELANLIKASSVLSVISLFELTKAGDAIIASTFKFAEVLLLQSILYFAVIQLLSWSAVYLEQRVFNYGNGLMVNPVSGTANPPAI
ncbi:amino acid ABC transporter permease [Oscillatoria sp. FACHB-1407]|uniref:amino acid ABC transporter permease n=1 Tax=Oscillatoria sp. FACHB-1407 TaxID=2692847 RepID=UPI001687BB32|nr:amino acid ABC transporter permease [Oscillatoria sp. FACHB-1407]